MATIYDVDANKLIEQLAKEFETIEEISAPEWATLVKTGVSKQRPPTQDNWWYLRSAAILRKVSLTGPIGVSKLRTQFGSLKNRGNRPEKFFKSSGNIIRKMLQQLDKSGLTKYVEKDVHKGRIVTPKGQSMLDKAAGKIYIPLAKRPKEE